MKSCSFFGVMTELHGLFLANGIPEFGEGHFPVLMLRSLLLTFHRKSLKRISYKVFDNDTI